MISTTSCQCKTFATSEESAAYGNGGIRYWYAEGSSKRFPEDVTHVVIQMPVTWKQIHPPWTVLADPDIPEVPVELSWAVEHPQNSESAHRWALSGTFEKPTLSPSLFWLPDIWHGFLTDGYLRSC